MSSQIITDAGKVIHHFRREKFLWEMIVYLLLSYAIIIQATPTPGPAQISMVASTPIDVNATHSNWGHGRIEANWIPITTDNPFAEKKLEMAIRKQQYSGTSSASEDKLHPKAYRPEYAALVDIPPPHRTEKKTDGHETQLLSSLDPSMITTLRSQIQKYYLQGYNCDSPRSITAVSSDILNPCMSAPIPSETIAETPISHFQVLQRETTREIEGHRCSKRLSRLTFYCGRYDHSTPVPQLTHSDRPAPVSAAECHLMAHSGDYTSGDGRLHTIAMGETTVFEYFSIGSTSAGTKWDGRQVYCEGGQLTINGQIINNIVQYVTESVTVQKEKIIQREDESLVAFYDNVRLTCALSDLNCRQSRITYVWSVPTREHCPLLLAKEFKGSIVTSDVNPQRVLMSRDGSLLRFILKGRTEFCGRTVYRTNYPKLYVFETLNEDGTPKINRFTQKVPTSEVDLGLYITTRDDTLYHRVKAQLRSEFHSVLNNDCMHNYDSLKLNHYIDRKLPGYYNYRIGGANYITASGDVAYTYRCTPVLLRALETKRCYNALAVATVTVESKDDLTKLLKVDGTHEEIPVQFMEPLTHRVTSTAAEIPCVTSFFARYRDIFGRWFAVTPRLKPTSRPAPLTVTNMGGIQNISLTKDDDFSQGGLYSQNELEALQRYLELGRVQEALTYKLAAQVGRINAADYISPHQLFPPYAIPGGSWHTFILGKLWGWLRSFGEFASAMIAIVFIVRFLWFLGKLFFSCRFLHEIHGCSRTLAWAFCSEMLFMFRYRQSRAARGFNNRRRSRQQPNQYDRVRAPTPDRTSCVRKCFSGNSDNEFEDLEMTTPVHRRPPPPYSNTPPPAYSPQDQYPAEERPLPRPPTC